MRPFNFDQYMKGGAKVRTRSDKYLVKEIFIDVKAMTPITATLCMPSKPEMGDYKLYYDINGRFTIQENDFDLVFDD